MSLVGSFSANSVSLTINTQSPTTYFYGMNVLQMVYFNSITTISFPLIKQGDEIDLIFDGTSWYTKIYSNTYYI